MNRLMRSVLGRFYRECSHGDLIERLFEKHRSGFRKNPVFVETGCGLSTISLSKCAGASGAKAFSLDYNSEKSDSLKKSVGDQIANVEFVIGDSLTTLPGIVEKCTIDFLFLDSAASAMHTFREFLICEPVLLPGACLLVDNATLPGAKLALSPARKGKILVPYLLASPYWEVRAHPRAGDSMISATLHREPAFADPDYQDAGYVDDWQSHFERALEAKTV